nr:MAG TPA: phosphoadenosine-phosphosulfate reductase [Caudoviricetes sp.]
MVTEDLQKKIDRAIRLLQGIQHGYDGEIEVAYSGGKDSDVILQLAKEAGIRYRAIYRNTTIDPPGTIVHVGRMGAEILRPKETFFQLVAKKGFPNRFSRFCCEKLKEYKVMDKCIMGVRKSESSKRNERYNEPTECRFYGRKTEANHVEAIYPILDWTDNDVLAFVEDRHLTLAPVYYTSRGGKSTCRNASAVCAALSPQNASASSTSKNIRVWHEPTCVPDNVFGTIIPKQKSVNATITCTNGLRVTCSSLAKKIGRRLTFRCSANRTGRGSWKENLVLT